MKTLSQKLIIVADKLDAKTLEFDWYKPCRCCCGLVAQILLNKTMVDLFNDLNVRYKTLGMTDDQSWANLVNRICPITGRPTDEIFAQLYDEGLTRDDIIHLEYLSDPKVLALCPKKVETKTVGLIFKKVVTTELNYDERDAGDLANYLRGLAKLKEDKVDVDETEPSSPAPSNRISEMQNN